MSKKHEALEGLKDPAPLAGPPSAERPAIGLEVSAESEMITLSRNIDAICQEHPKKVIQFIGAHGGSGTSTVTREFAMVSADRLGKTVLLVDADHQNPSQHLFFRVTPKFQWGEIVRGTVTLDEAIHRIGDANLYVLPNLPGSPNVPKVLHSPAIKILWEGLTEGFDLVLIDSAPASSSHDGIALSRFVDGVVLVVEAEKTRFPVAESLKNQISQNGGNLIGMVFNKRRYHIPESVYRRL